MIVRNIVRTNGFMKLGFEQTAMKSELFASDEGIEDVSRNMATTQQTQTHTFHEGRLAKNKKKVVNW